MTIKFTFAAGGAGKITNSSERSPSGKPKVKRKIQLSILSLLFFNAAFFSPLLWRGAGGEALAQALWQPSGTSSIYTMRKVGVNTSNPLYPLDVKGNVHSSNATFDSSATAMKMIAQQAQFATAVVTGNLSVAGAVSAGSLSVNGNAVIGNQLSVNGNATINGQLSTNTITSSSGAINFGNNNLSTTGNVNSTNISALQASDSVQQSKLSALSSQIASIPQSQWTSNSDGSLSFTGDVFVNSLNAQNSISIGNFRFSNGANQPPPLPVTDSIRTKYKMAFQSDAGTISLASDTVKVGTFVSFSALPVAAPPPPRPLPIIPPQPVPGVYGQLNITGNVSASGDISSNTINSSFLNSTSITTQQLTINGGSMTADTLHAYKQLSVNHSLLVSKETLKNYAEVSTIDTAVALVLQKDTAGKVIIGTPVPQPFPLPGSSTDKLTVMGNTRVQGNVNISGKIITHRIISSDSVIYLGDSTIIVNQIYNRIYTNPASSSTYRGLGLGVGAYAKGNRSSAIGDYVETASNATHAIVVGTGSGPNQSDRLINTTPNSLMIGFGSTKPTIVVTSATTSNGRGQVFIATDPNSLTGNPTTYELNVGGTILSKEWIVKIGWCDFKFEPTYQRMTWKEKQDYISKYKHLPEIDSGKEIEANGLQAGKTMRGFIWNIEDNTMDIIDLQKENENLKKEVNELKKQMQSLIESQKK